MDEIDIKLPVSGKTVVLRNYTTHADDVKAEEVLYLGVNSSMSGDLTFPIGNVMASQDVYVRRLVRSIDGDEKGIMQSLDDLRTEDYKALQRAVEEIVERDSPKAPEA